jgi:hypothetical protein
MAMRNHSVRLPLRMTDESDRVRGGEFPEPRIQRRTLLCSRSSNLCRLDFGVGHHFAFFL